MGDARWLLGTEVQRDRDAHTLQLSQRSYIDVTLRRFSLDQI